MWFRRFLIKISSTFSESEKASKIVNSKKLSRHCWVQKTTQKYLINLAILYYSKTFTITWSIKKIDTIYFYLTQFAIRRVSHAFVAVKTLFELKIHNWFRDSPALCKKEHELPLSITKTNSYVLYFVFCRKIGNLEGFFTEQEQLARWQSQFLVFSTMSVFCNVMKERPSAWHGQQSHFIMHLGKWNIPLLLIQTGFQKAKLPFTCNIIFLLSWYQTHI